MRGAQPGEGSRSVIVSCFTGRTLRTTPKDENNFLTVHQSLFTTHFLTRLDRLHVEHFACTGAGVFSCQRCIPGIAVRSADVHQLTA